MGSTERTLFKYETPTGFFMQAEHGTDPNDFDNTKTNFGLIDRGYPTDTPQDSGLTQWQRFEKYVRNLSDTAPPGTAYKVLYMGRHGEDNVGEAKYGTKAWDEYWSKLDGDGELFWDDAHLTPKGTQQAIDAGAFFRAQFAEDRRMPAPQGHYVSPLYRCLQTANHTFSGLASSSSSLEGGARGFRPIVKELIREVMGEHTCDRRSSRSVIHSAFPDWEIESGFSEEDRLWRADHRETFPEHDKRTQALLDNVFAHDDALFVSFTSHSGTTASLLRVLGHRQFAIPTGALMPALVKATRIG